MLKNEAPPRLTASKQKALLPIPPKEILGVFGKRVKEERKRQNITQEQLAECAGVSDDTIKRIEKGESVKLDVAFNIALALYIPIQLLLPVQNEIVDDVILHLELLLEKLKSR